MKIFIDITPLYAQITGIGYYTKNLVNAISEIDDINKYWLFAGHSFKYYKENIKNLSRHFRKKFNIYSKPFPSIISLYNTFIPLEFYAGKIDIFHGTNFLLPNLSKANKVVTIHDLNYEINPSWYSPEKKRWVELARKSAKQADKIIAVSEATKKDIIEIYKIKPEKITVIYIGVEEPPSYTEETLNKIKQKYSLPDRYFLFVGTLEPRKNIDNILKAFSIFKKTGMQYKLLLAGGKGWMTENLYKTIENLNLKNDVVMTGYINNIDLHCIYRNSTALLYPSFYEGFGIPILEAMANSVPVITSNISSMPEVAGEAGILVNPYNPDEIADAMIKIATDENLRKELIIKGSERVKIFTWEKTAIETVNLYRNLL